MIFRESIFWINQGKKDKRVTPLLRFISKNTQEKTKSDELK